jgi:hypothetical protein
MCIEYNLEKQLITAMCSREGEKVVLQTPIDLSQNPKINEWLRKLELEMQTTLSKLLSEAHGIFSKFNAETIQPREYTSWIDAYPVNI